MQGPRHALDCQGDVVSVGLVCGSSCSPACDACSGLYQLPCCLASCLGLGGLKRHPLLLQVLQLSFSRAAVLRVSKAGSASHTEVVGRTQVTTGW